MRALASWMFVGCLVCAFPACDDDAPSAAADAGTSDAAADVVRPENDAAVSTDAAQAVDATGDATSDAAPGPLAGSLETKASGTLPSTAKLGAFTPTRGSVQVRPRAGGGAVVTALVGEDPSAAIARTVEITIDDDTTTVDAGERFGADAASQPVRPFRRARVEVYQSDGKSWLSDGDGEVVVVAISASSITLQVKNVGHRGAGGEVLLVDGTVTLPIVKLPDTSFGTASVVCSNVLPEPVTNEPANLLASPATLASAAATLSDKSYPFTNDRRSAAVSDVASGTTRNLRIAFPTGHLPRVGQSLPLDAFDRVAVVYFEGAAISGAAGEKVWEADRGTLVVDARTATSITLRLVGARMQSESAAAKGLFTLDGTVTVPVAGE